MGRREAVVSSHHALDTLVPAPPETGTTFPLLDTFRAIGAVAVLTTHAAIWAGDYTRNGTWGTLLARLDVGVAIFFVLSGFLLSRPHFARAAVEQPAPGVGRYLWKRALRILPVYFLAVALALTFIQANQNLDTRTRVITVFMLNTFLEPANPAGLSHMWSLAVEMTFYLGLPLLMLVAIGRRRTLRPWRVFAVLVLMVATSIWWHLDGAARAGERSEGQPAQWLPSYLSWFAVGIGLALLQVLHERGRWPRLSAPFVFLGRQPGSCWVLVAGLLLVSATPLAGPTMLAAPTSAQSLTKHFLYAAIGGLVVLTGVFAVAGTSYSKVFGHGVLRRLGWISYGIFALHLCVLHFVMWATGWELFVGRGFAIWLIALVISIVVAEVVYRVLERPALRLKNLRFTLPRPRGGRSTSSEATDAASATSTR